MFEVLRARRPSQSALSKCASHQSPILTLRRLAFRYRCRRRRQLGGCGSLHRFSWADSVEGLVVDCVRARLCLILDLVISQEANSTTSMISFVLKNYKTISKSRYVRAIDNLHVVDDRYRSTRTRSPSAERTQLHTRIQQLPLHAWQGCYLP